MGIAPIFKGSQVGADYVGFAPRKWGPSVWDGTIQAPHKNYLGVKAFHTSTRPTDYYQVIATNFL